MVYVHGDFLFWGWDVPSSTGLQIPVKGELSSSLTGSVTLIDCHSTWLVHGSKFGLLSGRSFLTRNRLFF